MSLLLLFSGAGATAEAPVIEPVAARGGGARAYLGKRVELPKPKYIDVHKDDEEILEIIISSILSGVLD